MSGSAHPARTGGLSGLIAGLRDAEWLGPARARAYLVILGLTNIGMIGLLLVTANGGIDRNGFLLGTDFISFWTAGRMLHTGANVYDIAAHIAAQREFYAVPGEYTAFFYPPGFLPMVWPLGLMPYFAALAVWLCVTGGLWFWVVRAWFARLGLAGPGPLLAAAFPPLFITLTHGQTAFLVAALLAGGLLLVRERPCLAGILLGLATIKPQFGLLVPVALLAGGHWRTIIAAGATAIGLAAMAELAFGPGIWSNWLSVTGAAGSATGDGSIGFAKMISLFAGLRLLGVPNAPALAVQVALTLGLAGAVAVAAWRRPWTPGLAALVLAGAPLATPFVLDYDLVLIAFPLAFVFAGASRDGFLAWERIGIGAGFAAAAFARPLAIAVGLPLAPWVLLGLFALVFRRVRTGIVHPVARCASEQAQVIA